ATRCAERRAAFCRTAILESPLARRRDRHGHWLFSEIRPEGHATARHRSAWASSQAMGCGREATDSAGASSITWAGMESRVRCLEQGALSKDEIFPTSLQWELNRFMTNPARRPVRILPGGKSNAKSVSGIPETTASSGRAAVSIMRRQLFPRDAKEVLH